LPSRVQTVHAVASPFSPDDVGSIDAAFFHLGPLTNRDISLDVLQAVSHKGKLVSLDVQGFVREVEHGKVTAVDWHEKTEGLPYIDLLKAGEQEARVLSGEVEVAHAALRLASYGPVEVVITCGSKGSVILSAGKFFYIPALPAREIIDPTGCGDTYMAGSLYQRLHSGDLHREVGTLRAISRNRGGSGGHICLHELSVKTSEREVIDKKTGAPLQLHRVDQSLSQILADISRSVPAEGLTLRELLERLGERGLLLLILVLTIPFLFPRTPDSSNNPLRSAEL
jgi:hypothetical protein